MIEDLDGAESVLYPLRKLKRREGEHARNEKTKNLEFQVDRKTDNKDA
jgi:hypothetical protein